MRRAANAWDRFYRRQPAPWRGEHQVADLVARLPPGPVLELGAGNGKMLRPLLRAGVDAIGLDVSWNVLRTLRPNLDPAYQGNLVLADAVALPFGPDAFAAVLDIHCTGHLLAAGRLAAAREVARVLRPGGLVVTERLAPDDLRTSTGSWIADEPRTRIVEDGRLTHFSDAAELEGEYAAAGLVAEDRANAGRDLLHRGVPVRRASVRVWLRKP